MREKIDCFLPCNDVAEIADSLQTLSQSKTTQHINLLVSDASDICACGDSDSISDCTVITIDGLTSTKTLLTIEEHTDAEYVLLSLKHTPVSLGLHALDRLLRVATDSNAGMVYADCYIQKDGVQEKLMSCAMALIIPFSNTQKMIEKAFWSHMMMSQIQNLEANGESQLKRIWKNLWKNVNGSGQIKMVD